MDSGEKWKIFNDPANRVTKCRETLVSSSLRYRGSDKKPNREFSTRIRIEAKSTRIVRKMDIEVSFVFFFSSFLFHTVMRNFLEENLPSSFSRIFDLS